MGFTKVSRLPHEQFQAVFVPDEHVFRYREHSRIHDIEFSLLASACASSIAMRILDAPLRCGLCVRRSSTSGNGSADLRLADAEFGRNVALLHTSLAQFHSLCGFSLAQLLLRLQTVLREHARHLLLREAELRCNVALLRATAAELCSSRGHFVIWLLATLPTRTLDQVLLSNL
jgi:hypothetical protein